MRFGAGISKGLADVVGFFAAHARARGLEEWYLVVNVELIMTIMCLLSCCMYTVANDHELCC